MDQQNFGHLAQRILTLAMLAILWIGAYCLLESKVLYPVNPPTRLVHLDDGLIAWQTSDEVFGFRPQVTYQFENTFVRCVFWPIQQLDRLIRPKHWQYVPWPRPSGVNSPSEKP